MRVIRASTTRRGATPLAIAALLSLAAPVQAERTAARRVVEHTAALGQRAEWTAESPKLPIYANTKRDLLQWTKGRKALPAKPRLNCWEVIFAGAVDAGALSPKRVRSMYAKAARAGKKAFLCGLPDAQRRAICSIARREGTDAALSAMDDATYASATRGHQTYLRTLVGQLGPRRPLRQAREGDLVVFSTPGDPVCHVALASGKGSRAKGHPVLTFGDYGMQPATAEAVRQIYAETFGRCTVSAIKPNWGRLSREVPTP